MATTKGSTSQGNSNSKKGNAEMDDRKSRSNANKSGSSGGSNKSHRS